MSGVSTTAIQIGGAIGVAILATVASMTARHPARGTPMLQTLADGYTHAFGIGSIMMAGAVPISLALLHLRPSAGANIRLTAGMSFTVRRVLL